MPSHKITLTQGNKTFETLEDILPLEGEKLKILFVGRVPSPESVEFGHYWQGKHGQSFWRLLREYNILDTKKGIYNGKGEDDYLLPSGYGMTDIAKNPRYTGYKVYKNEYQEGFIRLSSIIERFDPEVIVFMYKTILRIMVNSYVKYGFNDDLHSEALGNSKVFVFPIPGVDGNNVNSAVIEKCMNELKDYLRL